MKERPVLRDLAFHGIIGEITLAIAKESECDPAALLFSLLAMTGCMIGRYGWYPVSAQNHFCKLFVAVVGSSARGRKSMAIGQAKWVFDQVFPKFAESAFTSGLSTGQGLIHQVRDATFKSVFDEAEGEYNEVQTDPGVYDKRKIFIEDELAHVLAGMKNDESIVSPTLRKAWDDVVLATTTKRDSEKSTCSHVCIIGSITRPELREKLKTGELLNGFVNRFLWCHAEKTRSISRPKPFRPEDFAPLFRRLEEVFSVGKEIDGFVHFGEMFFDDEAGSHWDTIYDFFSQEDDTVLGELTARGDPQVVRLATIYAICDRSESIKLAHLSAAVAVWLYSVDSVRHIFGSSLKNPDVNDLIEFLAGKPEGEWIPRSAYYERKSRHISKAKYDEALAVGMRSGLIERNPEKRIEKGRPLEEFRLTAAGREYAGCE